MASEFELELTSATARAESRDVYTPSRLNREARTLLERRFPAIWVEGEMSNLSRPSSGHWYFSLKDEGSQLRCAMFRQRNLLARFTPKDGLHVQLRGRLSLYEPRGDYQLIVDYIEEAGAGILQRRFELLKAKLAGEGLFAAERKRPLPRFPRRIGVITSPTGAAIRDLLNILRRRFCSIPVLVYPVQVQGDTAAAQIARTIRRASQRAECDVLILARGGGSLEDLWAFNEEIVARAIFDSAIPIVSGVGHEVDFTIADFVADVRAPTPSGAAELVAPDCNEWQRNFAALSRRLTSALQRNLALRKERFVWLRRRMALVHPGVELRQRAQRLDELEQRLLRAVDRNLHRYRTLVAQHTAHLRLQSPALRVSAAQARLQALQGTLRETMQRRLEGLRNRWALATNTLDAVSPLATLQRGYAIVTDAAGHVVTDTGQLQPDAIVHARLARGSLRARVEHIETSDSPTKPPQ
jgi:exodeoxyribonuclease VII large subunit